MGAFIRLVSAVALLLAIAACAAPQKAAVKDLTYQQVLEAPKLGKEEIYERSRVWFAQTFRSSKQVIEYADKEAGVIVGNGTIDYPLAGASVFEMTGKAGWMVRFLVREEIKDGRARIAFEGLVLVIPPRYDDLFKRRVAGSELPVTSQEDADRIRPRLAALAEDLGKHLTSSEAKSAW